ncbi:MAG: hypothetical protein Q4E50_04625 [Tissierellia bacterium]|nr:hypothetical protein [Tissierellia bacterium]
MRNSMRFSSKSERGIITIEASLVFTSFFLAYILLNSLFLSSFVESTTKKAINSMALDISNYSLILEKANISSYFEKTKEINLVEEIVEIGRKNVEKEQLDPKAILSDLISLTSKKLTYQAKTTLYNRVFSRLIRNYLKSENYLVNKGILNDYQGLDFSKSRILDGGEFEINLSYTLNPLSFLPIKLTRKVEQKALIITNIESKKLNLSADQTSGEKSIWHADNFTRGRYFASYIRENEKGFVLKLGQGLDMYSPEENILSQFHSINIFSKSYSDFDGENYAINKDAVMKELREKISKLEENIKKAQGSLYLPDGQIIKIKENAKKNLLLVMPEEAKNYKKIKDLEGSMIKDVRIRIIYLEKAL